ncbi:MAG: hypothetical protein V3R16_03720 [Nitrospirales bacterium]
MRLVDGRVYCLGKMFDDSTIPRDDNYASVQPVRASPQLAARD